MNRVILIGRTTRDTELRYLPSGQAVAKTGLAVSKSWVDKNTGEKKEEAMFIDIVVFGKQAETFHQYVLKGHRIAIEGSLKLEQWESEGKKNSKHTISIDSFEFLEGKQDSGQELSREQIRENENKIKKQVIREDDESTIIPF